MKDAVIWILGIMFVVVLLGAGMWGCPKYKVYNARMSGMASLSKAENERKIIIAQAQAEVEAAKHRAEAIEIVGEATKKYPEYRQQEFMAAFGEAFKEGNIRQIVYVPTEAMLPVLEATRLSKE